MPGRTPYLEVAAIVLATLFLTLIVFGAIRPAEQPVGPLSMRQQ